ncbi:MAG: deoxyguanosinetriphosphate triphosphohydrolase [Pseudomonadota bacterium]
MEFNIRIELEQREEAYLSQYAALSSRTQGRLVPEPPCSVRTEFQRDRDRIVHSKSFRRLKHKTQVFLSPSGDHYRTRLTHTLEVAQIARTIACALRLNEPLVEAIALGHDLGHTPFGHAGEAVLNEIFPAGFTHNEQSLRIVDKLEKGGKGLNLTTEVRDGILKHSKGKKEFFPDDPVELAHTVEGRVVRIADIITYVNHDLDDAIRGGVIVMTDIPKNCLRLLGETHSRRIDTMVKDIICNWINTPSQIRLSNDIHEATLLLRDFLYDHVYNVSEVHEDFVRAKKIISELYEALLTSNELFQAEIGKARESRERDVCDFIAGMTDRYALYLYEKMFLPRPWKIL